jgi:hypothetical protein
VLLSGEWHVSAHLALQNVGVVWWTILTKKSTCGSAVVAPFFKNFEEGQLASYPLT